MKKLILATKNKGKVKELEAMLAPFDIEVVSALDLDLPEVIEDRDTFVGNAQKKAEEVLAATGLPTLADDSGLCVDALDGAPGVFSARHGGPEKLLKALEGIPAEKRTAHFMCMLVFAQPGKEHQFFEGKVEGHVTTEFRGEEGFAYDPIFIAKGEERTFAEMNQAEKEALSHRGRAFAAFIKSITV